MTSKEPSDKLKTNSKKIIPVKLDGVDPDSISGGLGNLLYFDIGANRENYEGLIEKIKQVINNL